MSDFRIENGVLVQYTGIGGDVVIPDSVTAIGDNAFAFCNHLTSVVIPDSVISIGDLAFANCNHLTSVTIPDSVTSIGRLAFSWCEGLADKAGLVIVQSILYDYVGETTSVVIPDSVTSIKDSAFYDNENLTSVVIPDSVTFIGDSAFASCICLTSVTIPDSVTSIGNWAFCGCESLTSVTIPDSVTFIGDNAFAYCYGLTSVTIPDSVMSIGDGAFSHCTKLKDFACPQSCAKQLQAILPKTKKPITIHIPDISDLSSKFLPRAAVGFAEDHRDCSDENGQKYAKYIKSNAEKLAGLAIEHPALLYLMIHEKLITAKDLNAVMTAVQESGNTEWIAAMLEYSNSAVSEKDKAKVQQQQDQREANVTNFFFDAEKLEAIYGKRFAVTGKLKTFASRGELKECLKTCGAELMEDIASGVHYLITNTPDSGTAKNKKAIELGIQRITEDQFNEMIGRKVQK